MTAKELIQEWEKALSMALQKTTNLDEERRLLEAATPAIRTGLRAGQGPKIDWKKKDWASRVDYTSSTCGLTCVLGL